MKKLTLTTLALAAVIGTMPSSLYPVDTTKDGITIRVSNEPDRSERLKSSDLACLYVRIKNDTGAPIELPKYAVSSPLIAHEKVLTEIISSTPKEIGKFMARFIVGTGTQFASCYAIAQITWDDWRDRSTSFLHYPCKLGWFVSPLTGATWAIKSYLNQAYVNAILQEYLDRKATTIQIGSEFGFYLYVDLDQYQRSISKNITIRVHKKNTDEVILFEIDTSDALQIPIA